MIGQLKSRAHHLEILRAIANFEVYTGLDVLNGYKVRQSLVDLGYLQHLSKGNYCFVDTFLRYYLSKDNLLDNVWRDFAVRS